MTKNATESDLESTELSPALLEPFWISDITINKRTAAKCNGERSAWR
nr:hypothetical protein [Providencia sp. PROV019]